MPEVIRPSSESEFLIEGVVDLDFVPYEKHHEWVKWTWASINKHFMDRRGNYNLYLEGDERTLQDEAEFAELRIDGPFILQPHRGLYILKVEINVLVQTHMDHSELYKTHKAVGRFTKAFENTICVYKYGDEDLDDGSMLGSYHLSTDLRETVAINHYGIIREDTRLTQTTIEGHYNLELWNPGDS